MHAQFPVPVLEVPVGQAVQMYDVEELEYVLVAHAEHVAELITVVAWPQGQATQLPLTRWYPTAQSQELLPATEVVPVGQATQWKLVPLLE